MNIPILSYTSLEEPSKHNQKGVDNDLGEEKLTSEFRLLQGFGSLECKVNNMDQ